MHDTAHTKSLFGSQKSSLLLDHLSSLAALDSSVISRREPTLGNLLDHPAPQRLRSQWHQGYFQRLQITSYSSHCCSETRAEAWTSQDPSSAFANVAKTIPQIMDFAKFDIHLLLSVISHAQPLHANHLTTRLRQNRMTQFIELLFVGDLYWLIPTQHEIMRRIDRGKAKGKHLCRQRNLKTKFRERKGSQERKRK